MIFFGDGDFKYLAIIFDFRSLIGDGDDGVFCRLIREADTAADDGLFCRLIGDGAGEIVGGLVDKVGVVSGQDNM